jgi:hypothetical protein
MTFYLNFRAQSVGGGVIDPRPLQGDVDADLPAPVALGWLEVGAIRGLVAGRDLLLGVHGFNVTMDYGTRMMARLEPRLGLTPSDVFFGVLWPGDCWLPGVDYPFEGDFAIDSGNRLATFCNIWFAGARSISFLSHSLGARVVLQALSGLQNPARSVCLTAAAVNQRALAEEYAFAAGNAAAISMLASRQDRVLRFAYPPGDAISDALHHDHPYFEPALGYDGPPPPPPRVSPPWQIPDSEDYDHGDYHPSGDPGPAIAGPVPPKWLVVADYMSRAYRGLPQSWP